MMQPQRTVLANYRALLAYPDMLAVYEAGFLASLRRVERLSDQQIALLREIARKKRKKFK
jgi:hypothetical protein